MKKFLKIVGIIVLLLGILVVVADKFVINQENLDYSTNIEMIDAQKIIKLSRKDTINVIMVSSTCPGRYDYTPKLNNNLKKLSIQNKPYYVIADELYKDNLDEEIADYKKEFRMTEKVYLLDKNKYEKNGGLFNNKARYNSFISELAGENHNIPLGYGVYLKVFQGKIVSFNNTI